MFFCFFCRLLWTVPLWLRYVDDTFTAVHKDGIDDFHEHLNRQNADIQFTKEIEENGKIPFLDCLVTRDNNKLKTTIYRKPTHTDRLLDQSSYNPTSHKAATIRTQTRRAQLVCDSPDSLQDETDYLSTTFLVRTITTRTLLDGPLTVTLIPTLRTTLALLRQRLYRTSEAPLKLLHVYYNLTLVIVVTKSAPDLLTPCGCPCICHEPLKCSFRFRVSEWNSQLLFVSWVNENSHTCHA